MIQRRGVAVGGVEEEVDALCGPVHGWGFNEGPVEGVAVEDLGWFADGCEAVCAADFLEHERGWDDGQDVVAAGAAVSEGVAVDFVDDVASLRGGVGEAGWVDCAAVGADDRFGERGVGACYVGRGCRADAVGLGLVG